jgi:hypothetical protein
VQQFFSHRALKIAAPIVAALATWLITGYTSYSAQEADKAARITKLEIQRQNDVDQAHEQAQRVEKRLDRIEEKIDVLVRRGMR